MNDLGNFLTSLYFFFAFIALTIAVFLACRELVCWYFKINTIIPLMQRQLAASEALNASLVKMLQVELAKKKERDEDKGFQLS